MKEIERIIADAGKENDLFFHIKIKNGPYIDLVIEGIGMSPDGRRLVSVAHYQKQNGDAMRNPEIVFLLDKRLAAPGFADGWFPVSIQNDFVGTYREALRWELGVELRIDRREMKDVKSFARVWNRNIKEQGFRKAAKVEAAHKAKAEESLRRLAVLGNMTKEAKEARA